MYRRSSLVLTCLLALLLYAADNLAQDNLQIGKSGTQIESYKGAQYDYSDPNSINIKVLLWGYVQYPGQYIIPAGSSLTDVISLAGGPTPDADLDDIRLFRVLPDSSQTITKYDYDDLLWNTELTKRIEVPDLSGGDILLIPGSPRFFAEDYLSITLSIVTALTSIAVLLVSIL